MNFLGTLFFRNPDPLKPFPTAERILNALARWIAIARFWRNQLASLGSLKITLVDSPYTPIISTAIGFNWCASARAAYLRRFRSSALFAAMPASLADLFRCTPTKVSTHVQSQTKLLPPLNGKTVIQSGRDPSPLSNPGGSKTDGRPAFWRALLTTSFIAECLRKRPALYLQDKLCKPLPPQRQEWGIQTSAPTLRAMATLKLSESRSVPSDETGKALSQAPLSFCAVPSNLALDAWSATRNMFSQFLSTIRRYHH